MGTNNKGPVNRPVIVMASRYKTALHANELKRARSQDLAQEGRVYKRRHRSYRGMSLRSISVVTNATPLLVT